ncbi:hypothetical protein ACH5RR_022875 [Cinchona calisaya]|uniref:Uncharacterized protein n=1 Tax=Cinchona calisaya TaxID=153742 RepID=A0ABD2ZE10_9GENT
MERKRRLRSGRSSVPAAAKTWKKKKVVTPKKDEDEKPKVDVKVANQAIPEVKESVTVKHEPINVEFKPQLRSKSSTFGSDQSTRVASETTQVTELKEKLQSKDDELQDVRKTLHGIVGVVSQLQDHVLHNPNQAGHSGQ